MRARIVRIGNSQGVRLPKPLLEQAGKPGRVVLDQLRAVDRERLRKRLGTIPPNTLTGVLAILGEMFEP